MSDLLILYDHLGGFTPTYATILKDDYAATEVWPCVDIASGTDLTAFITSAWTGTLSGWALQNSAGPVSNSLAPSSDGTNDYGSIYTAGHVAGFDPAKGSLFIWGKVSGAGVWTDSTARYAIVLRVDANNAIVAGRHSGNNTIRYAYSAGGTSEVVDHTTSTTAWFSLGLSWDTTADEVKAFFDGSQTGSTQSGLGTWAGSLAAATTNIGALTTGGAGVWDGFLAYAAVKYGSVWTPTQFAAMHSAASYAAPD